MLGQTKISPKSWIAFDLNVLRRLSFTSAAIPFNEKITLSSYLKRWNVKIAANDSLSSAYTRSAAYVANGGEMLTEGDVAAVLEDVYVPGYRLTNPSLSAWFGETDSWWFDNVKRNIDGLATPVKRAIASSIVLAAGDYAMAFDKETRELRQPLSSVFKRLWASQPTVFNNGRTNTAQNRIPDDFIAETTADLLFLRLPPPHANSERVHLGRAAWREEWLRGGNEFWPGYEASMYGRLGSATETKSQYLHLLEETLKRSSHIKKWAIAHVEDGFIHTQDIADTVGNIRKVETVYTKDFTELTGAKAVIITA